MSMQSSFVYGFGFVVVSDGATLRNFIKNHKETFCVSEKETKLFNEMLEDTSDEVDLEHLFEDYDCDNSSMEGYGAVIANIISRETSIRFGYQHSNLEDGCPIVLFSECLPWNYNEVEKSLTEEHLREVCKKYTSELEIDDNMIGCYEVEYYG